MYTDDLITVILVVQYLFDGKSYHLCIFQKSVSAIAKVPFP